LRSSRRLRVGIGLHAAVNVVFAAVAMVTGQVPVPSALAAVALPTSTIVTAVAPTSTSMTTTTTAPPVAAVRSITTAVSTTTTTRSTTTTTTTTTTVLLDTDRSVDRFDRLAMCESSGNPTAVHGPHRGAFQFLLETWHAAGGAGDPVDASYEDQRAVAMHWAQVDDPAQQWPVCWPSSRR
jgi:hypothetical protein